MPHTPAHSLRHRWGRSVSLTLTALTGLALALVGTGAASATVGADGRAAWRPPSYVTTIGHPGHAGVYAWGAATATDGSILIGDYWNYVVRRYSTSGELLQTIGGRGNGPGRNQAPYGLAVDPASGDLYIADPNSGNSIDRYSAAGTYLNTIRIPARPAVYATHLAVGPDGLLYVTNSQNVLTTFAEVLVFAPGGTLVRAFGQTGSGDGTMGLLRGIAVSAAGEVFLADAGHQRVEVFTTDGTWVRSFGAGRFGGDMRGSAIDEVNGFYYVNDAANSQVEKFALDGTWIAALGSEGTGAGQFRDGGRELTVGADGIVYAPDYGNNRVNRFAADGSVLSAFPDPPQDPPVDGFNQPQGMALSGDGASLYVADTYNHRVVRFDALTGAWRQNWGFRGTTDPMAMNYPRGIAVDPSTSDVFLLNSRQSQIKKYTRDGAFITSWGSMSMQPGGMSIPRGISAQGGKVYVADGPIARVSIYSESGAFLSMFPCGTLSTGMLGGCNGLAISPTGPIYATCLTENAICVFDRNGVLVRKLGSAFLKSPYDVALYKGNLYVTSARKVDVMTTAGKKVGSFANVGGVAPHTFNTPRTITISSTGRAYVLDSANEHVDVFQIK